MTYNIKIAKQERFIRTIRKFYSEQREKREFSKYVSIPLIHFLPLLSRNLRSYMTNGDLLEYTDEIKFKNKSDAERRKTLNQIIREAINLNELLFHSRFDLIDLDNKYQLENILRNNPKNNEIIKTTPFGFNLDASIDNYLRFLERTKFTSAEGFKLEFITNNTYCDAIGLLTGNESKKKYMLKITQNIPDFLREHTAIMHGWSSRLLSTQFSELVRPNYIVFLSSGKCYFLLTSDISQNNHKKDISEYEYLKRFNVNSNDIIGHKMFLCAAFHTEMKDMHDKYYLDLYKRNPFKKIELLKPILEKHEIYTDKIKSVYEATLTKYQKDKRKIFSHNDLKKDNWVNGGLIDFGSISKGYSSELETALMETPFEERDYYRELYLNFRSSIEADAGYFYRKPSFSKFREKCIMRGFLDSVRFLAWNLKREEYKEVEFYNQNLMLYMREIQRFNLI